MGTTEITPEMVTAALRQDFLKNQSADLLNDHNAIPQAKRLFVNTAREICPGWEVRPEHRNAINAVFYWCMGFPDKLDLDKGLWLWGNIGTGKSTLLEIVKAFCRKVGRRDRWGNPYGFRIVNVKDVCALYQEQGETGIDEFRTLRRQAFDDLGTEPKATGHYGTPLDVMGNILMGRYDRRHENMTHVTTNLSLTNVRDRYDERVYDRCKEMFNFVFLGGRSYRGDNVKSI